MSDSTTASRITIANSSWRSRAGSKCLRAFTPSEGLLGNQEIAARTGLAKATVSRLTYTLTTLGYLAHIDRLEKYQLAPGALAIGYSTLANMRIRQVAKPHMQALANYTGASVALGTRDRLNAIYIEFCRGKSATMLRLDVGARIPLATTAMGRALLAGAPVKDQQRLLRQIARRESGKWTKIRPGVERALKDVDSRGFSISVGEWQSDINAVGVPLAAAGRLRRFRVQLRRASVSFQPLPARKRNRPAAAQYRCETSKPN